MNSQKTEYFNQLLSKSSPKSNSISQSIALKGLQEVSVHMNKHLVAQRLNFRVKTQSSERAKQLQQNAIKLNGLNLPDKMNQLKNDMQKLQLVFDEQKQINKCQQERKRLKIIRKHYAILLKESTGNLQRLKAQKQIAMSIRRERELTKNIQQLQYQKKRKLQSQQRQMAQRRQKHQMIEKRMEKIDQYKRRRQQILSSKSLPSIPKYKIMEKKFLMEDIKKQVDRNVQRKRFRQLKYKNYIGLGSIQGSRINRMKTEPKYDKQDIIIDKKQLIQKQKDFLFLLQEKNKDKIIKIDKEKQIQRQILKDKIKNPLKYNFLKLKNLTQQQIFVDFKDFQMNFDSKTLGNQYMQAAKKIIKKSDNQSIDIQYKNKEKSFQENISKEGNQQHKYRNRYQYNIQRIILDKGQADKQKSCIKQESQKSGRINKEEINKMLRNSQSKSKVIELLSSESNKKQKKMVQLKQKLINQKKYQQLLKIQKSIDSDYLQFLKAKIIALGLQISE